MNVLAPKKTIEDVISDACDDEVGKLITIMVQSVAGDGDERGASERFARGISIVERVRHLATSIAASMQKPAATG